jgi:hypothetical protein
MARTHKKTGESSPETRGLAAGSQKKRKGKKKGKRRGGKKRTEAQRCHTRVGKTNDIFRHNKLPVPQWPICRA